LSLQDVATIDTIAPKKKIAKKEKNKFFMNQRYLLQI
jgi:hypothetical protein